MVTDPVEVIEGALVDLLRLMSSRRLHDARAEAVGVRISHTQLHFLTFLEERGPTGVSRLAESAGISQPAASRALGHLEADGYVTRDDDHRDRRVSTLVITPAGRLVNRRLHSVMRRQLSDALTGMPAARQVELGSLLAQLVDCLKAPSAGPARRAPIAARR